jgi:hypothetical protein
MAYVLKQQFYNAATGVRYSAGRTMDGLPWLTPEQIQGCLDEGSLEEISPPVPSIEPDDLTQLPYITPELAYRLNQMGVQTFGQVVRCNLTALPGIGVAKATEIKHAAAGGE